MALDFIVTALPRSGTTWAANWLTTDKSICLHDALGDYSTEELDARPNNLKRQGISCTAAWLKQEWIENHPGKVLILERDPDEVNQSLVEIGLPPLKKQHIDWFKTVKGVRIPYTALFDAPEELWTYLMPGMPFDEERHAELKKMNIQPTESVLVPDAAKVLKAIERLGVDAVKLL